MNKVFRRVKLALEGEGFFHREERRAADLARWFRSFAEAANGRGDTSLAVTALMRSLDMRKIQSSCAVHAVVFRHR